MFRSIVALALLAVATAFSSRTSFTPSLSRSLSLSLSLSSSSSSSFSSSLQHMHRNTRMQMQMQANPFEDFLNSLTGGGGGGKQKLSCVAITGATGMIGTELTRVLEEQGVKVVKVSTRKLEGAVYWDPLAGTVQNPSLLEGVEVFVHLAGENVASGEGPLAFLGTWSDAKKQRILASRVDGTKLLVDTIAGMKKKPRLLISASAAGVYGYRDENTLFDEANTTPGEGFLAQVCREWESEALKAQKAGVRTVCLRLPPVLSTRGGILAKLLPIFGLGAGGALGAGGQGFSWVSLGDVVRAVLFVAGAGEGGAGKVGSLKGPINVCSPNPSTNLEFTKAFGKALSRPAVVPVPGPVIGLLGEMGAEMLLGGQRCVPTKLGGLGFEFEDSDLEDALRKIVQQKL
ncbi:hypothetical protein B484DRAFT_448137 [Ochromonadaceae sp. CCMP2298]|nr:hypothetical protein B484DRAFT_448137 [Ochromonadaceae sp. CCMP2298]